MKKKDLILLGLGAVALYYLYSNYQQNSANAGFSVPVNSVTTLQVTALQAGASSNQPSSQDILSNPINTNLVDASGTPITLSNV